MPKLDMTLAFLECQKTSEKFGYAKFVLKKLTPDFLENVAQNSYFLHRWISQDYSHVWFTDGKGDSIQEAGWLFPVIFLVE